MPNHLKVFVVAFCFLALVFAGLADAQKSLSVQVQEGQMRSAPSFLGTIVARLPYGERVVLIDDQGAWKKVSGRGVQGWIDASALTTKTIVLRAGANVQTGASQSEISLAGKGFSEEVEKEYKSRNKNIDFAWVERMQRYKVTPEEMQAFLKQGQVDPAAGGVK